MSKSNTNVNPGALSGVKVVDLTHALAGPTCSMILADMGAEVVKVEQPVKDDGGRFGLTSAAEMARPLERNKKSVTLNLQTEKGKEILRSLIKWGDVLVENYRSGVMQKWGFGYPAVREINPRIIMTSISGYGQTGPYAHKPALGGVAEALSGLISVLGSGGGPPIDSSTAVSDLVTGVFGALGTALALYKRESTGVGQYVESTLLESTVFFMGWNMARHIADQSSKTGSSVFTKRIHGAGSGIFQAKDGTWVFLMAEYDQHWPIIARVMGREDIAKAPGYATFAERQKNYDQIQGLLKAWVGSHTFDEVETIINKAGGIPFDRVQTLAEVLNDPHLKSRGWYKNVDSFGKPLPQITPYAPYPVLSDTPGTIRKAAPRAGESNEEIYSGVLGLSKEELANLKSQGVI
jgi:crotonobetainyl-CoA:carnitine CoA-transferase CaiB-like acyl-CoA transferase